MLLRETPTCGQVVQVEVDGQDFLSNTERFKGAKVDDGEPIRTDCCQYRGRDRH
jgi:hypothetical protein